MVNSPKILPDKKAAKNAAQKAAPPGLAPAFEVRETAVCAVLGMSKDELRRRREHFLAQGQHWDYVDKRVMLSRIGAQILAGTKNASLPARQEARPATADSVRRRGPVALLCEKNPPPVRFTGQLIAWAAPPHNRKVVICHLPGTDPLQWQNLVTLRVRDNSNFLRGMPIPGTKPPGNRVKVTGVGEREDVFDLQGPVPRWKGRW